MRRNYSKTLATPNLHRFRLGGTHPWAQNSHNSSSSWYDRKRMRKITKSWKGLLKSWKTYLNVGVRLFSLVVLSFMIFEETRDYNSNPTSTAVEDDEYPVQKVNFPAIAICNLNLISKQKVKKYAQQLWGQERVKRIHNLTLDRLEGLLKYMGHVYTFSNWEESPGDLKFLHHILNVAYNNNYDMVRTVEHIMPHCRESLMYCSWKGEIRSCEELFVPRWTPEGSCCTFNYLRWTDTISDDGKNDFEFHVEKSKFSTMANGLRVYLDPRFDDDFYSILPIRGYKLFIFFATDYPDTSSGSMKEVLLNPGSDNYISLKGASFYSSDDVKRFDKSKRQCLFNNELPNEYGDSYSYTQCLMLCRTRDIVKACSCVPFFYPYTKEMASVRDCHIMDLDCLRTWRHKWLSVKPLTTDPKIDMESYTDNLECDCLASCEVVDFQVYLTRCRIAHNDIDLIDFVRNYNSGNVSSDAIILSINFASPTIMRLKQDVMFYWYDLLSKLYSCEHGLFAGQTRLQNEIIITRVNWFHREIEELVLNSRVNGNYGGLCSLFLGVSILTPAEMIYEYFLRFLNRNRKSKQLSIQANVPTIVAPAKIHDQSIYWKEMMQRKITY